MRIFIGVMIVCLLGSCASVNGVFMKRKYTRGYYLSSAQKKHDPRTVRPNEEKNTARINTEIVTIDPTPQVIVDDAKVTSVVSSPSKSTFGSIQLMPKTFVQHSALSKTQRSPGFKNKIQNKLAFQTQKASDGAAAAKFVLYVILFFVLTLIYTIVILVNNPSFPLALAIVVAMLGSLLTLLTGQLFI